MISVIVCTRNRAKALTGSLDAIARAMRPDVELVVVDNGSTDDTAHVLAAWKEGRSFPVRVVNEPRPGLSRARNAGLRASAGDIVVMTDDDCHMAPDYFDRLRELHGLPQVLGGRVELGDPDDLPVSILTRSKAETYTSARKPSGFVIGANLTFHRSVWKAIGDFDTRFGAGATFPAGEDSDFIFRAHLAGFPVRYDPTLVVKHFHGRRDRSNGKTLLTGYSVSDGALYAKHMFPTLLPARFILKAVQGSIRERVRPGPPHPVVGRLYSFQVACAFKGMIAYAREGGRA